MTKRKLASIRRIISLSPIEGADFIELAQVDGWQCVVKKDEFKVNDHCIYFEVDSWLPVEDRYEFLRKGCYKKNELGEGFVLRTIKLKGQLSQGLALPMKTFPEIPKDTTYRTDVTDLLNVKKFMFYQPAVMGGEAKGGFPSFIPKTDEERIQNLLEYFSMHKNTIFEVTEKLDGTSCTIYYIDGKVGVCSRNRELKISDDNKHNVYVKTAVNSGILEALKELKQNVAIQGEICGQGIAGHKKNPLMIEEQRLFVYHVWDIKKQEYLKQNPRLVLLTDLEDLAKKTIEHVPLLGNRDIFKKCENIDAILKFAEGNSKLNKESLREGLVFKSLLHPNVSFKAINNIYLYGDD